MEKKSKFGRCINFRVCKAANGITVLEISDHEQFVCPSCGNKLAEIKTKPRGMNFIFIISIIILVLSVYILFNFSSSFAKASLKENASLLIDDNKPAKNILTIHGSNTIGSKLAPALIEEFLRSIGGKKIHTKILDNNQEKQIVCWLDGEKSVVNLQAHGSSTGIKGLSASKCDIAMTSRRIKEKEATKLRDLGFGDLVEYGSENVLALDGIAVVVHKNNPITKIDKSTLAQIFNGTIEDWSEISEYSGRINVYVRDSKSGTCDTFKSLVMGKKNPFIEVASEYESNARLSDDVSKDIYGIGFTGLPFIRESKALAIYDKNSSPLIPTVFSVATEDYPLARRLYLYLPKSNQNNYAQRFINFSLSDKGQYIVEKIGFVSQIPQLQQISESSHYPVAYNEIANTGERLSINLRFQFGNFELDNKAMRDIDRIITFLSQPEYRRKKLYLVGFADNIGDKEACRVISHKRAAKVAQLFTDRGLAIDYVGLGSEVPVASNETEKGRSRNRRVEVWIRNN